INQPTTPPPPPIPPHVISDPFDELWERAAAKAVAIAKAKKDGGDQSVSDILLTIAQNHLAILRLASFVTPAARMNVLKGLEHCWKASSWVAESKEELGTHPGLYNLWIPEAREGGAKLGGYTGAGYTKKGGVGYRAYEHCKSSERERWPFKLLYRMARVLLGDAPFEENVIIVCLLRMTEDQAREIWRDAAEAVGGQMGFLNEDDCWHQVIFVAEAVFMVLLETLVDAAVGDGGGIRVPCNDKQGLSISADAAAARRGGLKGGRKAGALMRDRVRATGTTTFTDFQQDPARHAVVSARGAQASNKIQREQEVKELFGEGRVFKLNESGGSNSIGKGKPGEGYSFKVLNESISLSKEDVDEAFVGTLEIKIKMELLSGYNGERSYLTLGEGYQGEVCATLALKVVGGSGIRLRENWYLKRAGFRNTKRGGEAEKLVEWNKKVGDLIRITNQ
ncbi:hypothetical protein HDV05_006302, partial [Chytridiales sp. JEL 0842]